MNTEQEVLGLGAIPSPQDYRDAIAAQAVNNPTFAIPRLPSAFALRLAPVMMQGKQPACVSHDVVEAYKLWYYTRYGVWVDFSPRFLDILCKRFDGQDRETGGTWPRLAFKLLCLYGCATTQTLPNDTSLPVMEYRDDSLLTSQVMEEAASFYRPHGYSSVPVGDADLVRQHIALGSLVSTLFLIGNELWTPSWADADIDPLRTPEVIISGHQMGQYGWVQPDYNLVRNQFSAAWAQNGNAEFSVSAWTPYIVEQWVFAEIPDNITTFLATLPSATNFHYQWNTNMVQGTKTRDIEFAQVALMILGYLAPILPVEFGWYGPKTALAVYKFQTAHGIPVSPQNIGPLTRNALNKTFAL